MKGENTFVSKIEALKSETYFQILFENSPVGISITAIDGTIQVNKAFCSILGYSEDELREKNLMDITHPDDIELSKGYIQSLLDSKTSQARFEKRYIHKNGNLVWIDITTYLKRDDSKKPLFFLSTIIDITERKKAEEAQRNQEKELQIIIDSIPAWIYYKDTNNRFLRVNKAFSDTMGLSKNELESKSLFDLFPREQAEAFWKDDLEVIESGKAKINIVESMDSPKGMLWAQTDKIPYRDSEGKILGVIGFTIDITRQIEVEEQMQKSKDELERFFNLIPDLVCIASPQGYFTSVNDAWTEILGFTKEELLTVPFTWFIHPDDLEPTLNEVTKQIEGLSTFNFVNRYRCVDGSYRLLEWVGTPAIDGYLYAAARDITERRIAEDALKESEEFNKSILHTIPFGIDIVDDSGNIMFQNEIFENIFSKKAIGKKCWELYRDDKQQCPDCPLKKGVNIGITELYETHGVLDGRSFQISHTGMKFQGKNAILEIFQDITERKTAEKQMMKLNKELQELSNTKDKLLSVIAHDIRSPISSILGFSDLLFHNLHKYNADKSLSFIDNILTVSKHTLDLLNNLLDWAKMQTGKFSFEPENLNLKSTISEVVNVIKPAAKLKNISLNIVQPDDINVYADHEMLKTILRNLISNAIKFTNSDGKIEVHTVIKQNVVEIIIADNGVGMTEEIMNKLFKQNTGFTTKGTASEKGTGLGLMLCKEFIEKHGGNIWVESIPDKGSDFHFTLIIGI